jgi:hypothetical protein
VLARLADGESLSAICRDQKMPSRPTVYGWLRQEDGAASGFQDRYARARDEQASRFFDQVTDIADAAEHAETHEEISAAKLRIDSRKWVLARMAPTKYGDRMAVDVGGGDKPVTIVAAPTPEEAIEVFKILREAGAIDE